MRLNERVGLSLDELSQITGTDGSVSVKYTGPTDALIVNGGLEDASVGYSAPLPLVGPSMKESELPPFAKIVDVTSIAELGLMVGAADPMMNFPAGTTFTPYSVLRNVSNAPISLTPAIWWMQGGQPHSARMQPLQLMPYQSQNMDVKGLLATAGLSNFNGSFNLVFEGDWKPGSLIATAGSVDQTKTYVFEVAPRSVTEGISKTMQYWSTGNGDDTMITVWEPADEAQDFVLTLSYSGGHYLLPLHLEARATRSINVSEHAELRSGQRRQRHPSLGPRGQRQDRGQPGRLGAHSGGH